jgi:hypothetical protein
MNIARYQGFITNEDNGGHIKVAIERATRLRAWKGQRLAVMLSGGGYRAAMIHAGVLSVLAKGESFWTMRKFQSQ